MLPNENKEYVDHLRQIGALSAPGAGHSGEASPCTLPHEEGFQSVLDGGGLHLYVDLRKELADAVPNEGDRLDLA